MMKRSRWSTAVRVLAAIALVAYPVLVWRGLTAQSPRTIALVLLIVLAPAAYLRLRSGKRTELRGLAVIPLVTAVSLVLATALNSIGFILLVPVAINTVLLLTFGSTMRQGSMPMIERFARLQEDDLNSDQQAWCLLWTRIWCAFFLVNGSVASALGLFAPVSWWALYNGLLSYIASGILITTEWVIRRRRFAHLSSGIREESL